MIAGALIGGLIGGVNVVDTVSLMIEGAEGIIPAVLRILAAGVLAGVLIQSGAAATIAEALIKAIGEKKALLAMALATMSLKTVGVFSDVGGNLVRRIGLASCSAGSLHDTTVL